MLRGPLEPKQYTSIKFTEHLALEGIRPSIGSVGDAFDNALMETINGLYKAECIRTTVFHDGPYKTLADVEYASRRLGGLVQRTQAPWLVGERPSSRVRASPLRCPQPRAAARMRAAENLGRFRLPESRSGCVIGRLVPRAFMPRHSHT